MKASQLRELISKMIREEVRKQLPAMVESVLTERYLRHLVTEQASSAMAATHHRRPSSNKLSEVIDEQDEEIPQPLANTQADMYRAGVQTRKESKLLAPDNPFREIYEGVEPALEHAPMPNEVPLERLGFDFERMAKLASAPSPRPMSLPSARLLREQVASAAPPSRFDPSLDVPVGGGPARLPATRPQINPLLSRVMDMDGEDPMAMAEMELERRLKGVR